MQSTVDPKTLGTMTLQLVRSITDKILRASVIHVQYEWHDCTDKPNESTVKYQLTSSWTTTDHHKKSLYMQLKCYDNLIGYTHSASTVLKSWSIRTFLKYKQTNIKRWKADIWSPSSITQIILKVKWEINVKNWFW